MRTLAADGPLHLNGGKYERMAWVRVTEPMPDDPLVQACALTYLSDLSMVTTATSPHRDERENLQIASIDHAMWFHAPVDTHEWLCSIKTLRQRAEVTGSPEVSSTTNAVPGRVCGPRRADATQARPQRCGGGA